ncbi:MAG: SDR family oxidoreductase [Oscillospiraceae bacterium]|nr:SDR family oxidoreductase [Oscillospiraceae bacterium]
MSNTKHIIVTGGANGIGRCVAETFLKSGARVSVIDIAEPPYSHECLRFFRGDIADKNVLEKFVKSLDHLVDCLINNACVSRRGILSGCSYEDFEYVQRVGVTAPYYLTSLLLKNNLLAPNASIVNIASTRAFQSQPDTEAYTSAKGGIVALTHSMAVSLGGKARVNCISPGWIDRSASGGNTGESTELSLHDRKQHPAARVGTPADIAEMVLFLCSDKAGFITGENFTIDGGMSKLMIYHGDNGWGLE